MHYDINFYYKLLTYCTIEESKFKFNYVSFSHYKMLHNAGMLHSNNSFYREGKWEDVAYAEPVY